MTVSICRLCSAIKSYLPFLSRSKIAKDLPKANTQEETTEPTESERILRETHEINGPPNVTVFTQTTLSQPQELDADDLLAMQCLFEDRCDT